MRGVRANCTSRGSPHREVPHTDLAALAPSHAPPHSRNMATTTEKVSVTIEPAAEASATEAEAELEGLEEVAAQEEAEVDVAVTVNLSAVLTYKVRTAKSKADVVFASIWLVCGIFFAGVEVVALLAIDLVSVFHNCIALSCEVIGVHDHDFQLLPLAIL